MSVIRLGRDFAVAYFVSTTFASVAGILKALIA